MVCLLCVKKQNFFLHADWFICWIGSIHNIATRSILSKTFSCMDTLTHICTHTHIPNPQLKSHSNHYVCFTTRLLFYRSHP